MGVLILFFGLFLLAGWAVALGWFGYASSVLWRVRTQPWVRTDGHPCARLLLPTPAYLRFDKALAVAALLADLWLLSGIVLFGTEGIFTEGWMGYPGMMDPRGRGTRRKRWTPCARRPGGAPPSPSSGGAGPRPSSS